jgi:hypothetical protein
MHVFFVLNTYVKLYYKKLLFQVDFLSATIVEGIILYSLIGKEQNICHNLKNDSLDGIHAIFLEYAVAGERFIRFNGKVCVTKKYVVLYIKGQSHS